MAVYSGSTSDYLSQTNVPDNTGDWTIFLWLKNPSPAIVLPDYRIGLMLLEGTDYTDAYLGIQFEQHEGTQRVRLVGTTGTAVAVTVGTDTWLPFVLRYDSGLTTATLTFRRNGEWVAAGSILHDFTSVTWASVNLLADTIGGIGGVVASFYRRWDLLLTPTEAVSESESAVARRHGCLTDTPLQTVLNVDDVSGNGDNWTITGTPSDLWPGPLAGDLGLVLVTKAQSEGRWLAQRQMAMLRNVYRASVVVPADSVVVVNGFDAASPASGLSVQQAFNADTGARLSACTRTAAGGYSPTEGAASGSRMPAGGYATVAAGVWNVYDGAGSLLFSRDTVADPVSVSGTDLGPLELVGDTAYVTQKYLWAGTQNDAGTIRLFGGMFDAATGAVENVTEIDNDGGTGCELYPVVQVASNSLWGFYYLKGDNASPSAAAHDLLYSNVPGGPSGGVLASYAVGDPYPSPLSSLKNVALLGSSNIVLWLAKWDGSDTSLTNIGDAVTYTVSDLQRAFRAGSTNDELWVMDGAPLHARRLLVSDGSELADLDTTDWGLVAPWMSYSTYADYTGCGISGSTCAAVMGRAATYYELTDDAMTGYTQIVRQVDGDMATATATTGHYGEATGGRHCLMELSPSSISPYPDLLTVDRDTGDVIRITSEPNPVTLVQQTYGLTIAPFDGCVNTAGTRLLYVDGMELKAWDLVHDTDLGTVITSDVPIYWPIWLPDCTILVSTGGPGADGPVRRYSLADGSLVQSFAYSPTPYSAGQLGIAASMALNRLWIVGAWNDAEWAEQPAALMYSLADGAQIYDAIPAIGTAADPTVVVTQPYSEVLCTPIPPQPPAPTLYPVRRYMRFMLPWDDANRMKFISRLELLIQPGIGRPNTDAADPVVMLRLSKDGGKTFGDEIQMTAGALGDYTKRVYINRLGSCRNPVVELTVSDPVNWQILSLLADMETGTS